MGYRDLENESREIIIDSLSDFNVDYVAKHSRGANKITISFDLNIYDYDVDKMMYNFLVELKNSGYTFNVNIKTENKNFSLANMLQFNRLKKHLDEKGVKLTFDGGLSKEYDTKEVYLAQTKLQALVNRIKEANLSPFEKYLYIYDFLIEKIYKENQEDMSKARDIIATMTGEYIVCTGYAKLMERICKEVGIECKVQQCFVQNKNGDNYNHENNLVRIDDDKYNIHGWFYSDACWDHVDEKTPTKKTYAYCLLPLSDKDRMNQTQITVNDDALFYYDSEENQYKLIDGEYYGSTFGIDYQTGDYSKIIKDLGLEQRYKIEEQRVKEIYKNPFLRVDAINRVIKMMTQNKLPADIYEKKSEVPYGCSLEFLIALAMQRSNDYLVDERIKVLKKFYESDKTLDFEESARSFATNVYDELNALKEVTNFSDDIKWQSIDQKLVKIMMAGRVQKCLQSNGSRSGDPISIDSFKKALTRVYSQRKIAGNETIMPLVNDAIEGTVSLSEKIYSDNARNCFREEALLKQFDKEME